MVEFVRRLKNLYEKKGSLFHFTSWRRTWVSRSEREANNTSTQTTDTPVIYGTTISVTPLIQSEFYDYEIYLGIVAGSFRGH